MAIRLEPNSYIFTRGRAIAARRRSADWQALNAMRLGRVRVLIIDPDPARAALVAEGLAGVEPLQVRHGPVFDHSEAAIFAPDVLVVAADSPDRDVLESLREASASNPRPIVMFVDRSEPGLADEAVRAGVAAYVVDGLAPRRVRSILETAMSRFQVMQQVRTDLAKAKSELASRKVIEKAKALLAGSAAWTRTPPTGSFESCRWTPAVLLRLSRPT